jgi:hypothetical protein
MIKQCTSVSGKGEEGRQEGSSSIDFSPLDVQNLFPDRTLEVSFFEWII